MKKKVIKIISIAKLVTIMMLIGTSTKATVENKSGGKAHTNINVSTSYQLCYDMRLEELGNNTLEPHLTTNADWGAVAYLGVSAYGSVRSEYGTSVTIDGINYYSTTNNITGVINLGRTDTLTASLITGCGNSAYITKLKENLSSKYVETLGAKSNDASNKGRAFGETAGWYKSSSSGYVSTTYPVGVRRGVLGCFSGGNSSSMGMPEATTTYRPVLWNP